MPLKNTVWKSFKLLRKLRMEEVMWDCGLLLALSMDSLILILSPTPTLEYLQELEKWYTKPSNNLSIILIKLNGI